MHYSFFILLQQNSKSDDVGYLPFVVVMLLFVAFLYKQFKGTITFSFKLKPIQKEYQSILEKHFTYYQKLSQKDKIKFEKRVQYFIDTKHYIARNFKEVTPEMKTLIAASAVQISFGFKVLNLPHFKRILVYPDSYYSVINRTYHKGEVNPRARLIVLSWNNFLEGYLHPHNARNLGLHEMAHALRLENKIQNREYDFFDKKALARWEKLSKEEIEKIRRGEDSYLRKYAGANGEEFFAVAVEAFFEQPDDFKSQEPTLYEALAALLQQDPLKLFQKS